MNKVLSILVFFVLVTTVKGACNYFNYGPGQDQGVSVMRNGSAYTVLFGEIPRTPTMGLGFFRRNVVNNVFNRCASNNVVHSGACPSTITMADLLDHDNVELHYSYGSQSVSWQSGSYVSTAMDSVFTDNQFNGTMMSSGYRFQFTFGDTDVNTVDTESILDPNLYMFLIPRQLATGNWSSWNIGKIFTNGQEIVVFQIDNMTMSDDICKSFETYLGSSRWDVYNNWRHARYAVLMFTCVIIAIIVYLNSHNRLLSDRLFSIWLSLFFGIVYSATGFYFVVASIEFQGIDYLYYMAIPVLYFANFVVYILKKIFEEMNASFFIRAITTTNGTSVTGQKINLRDLKANTLAQDIDRNNALDSLRRCIPRQFTNVIIVWVLVVLCSQFIEIVYYDVRRVEPYPNFGISVTVSKFVSPIAATLIPAIIVFALSIYNFAKKRRMMKALVDVEVIDANIGTTKEHVFTGADFEKNRQSIKLQTFDLGSLRHDIAKEDINTNSNGIINDTHLHVPEFATVISRETTVGSIVIDIPKQDSNGKTRRKTNIIKDYFSSFEDPTLQRIAFAICLLVCLPSAISTFVIGNLDSLIPSYIYGRRIILLTFHGVLWIIFDVSFQLVVTGMVSMVWKRFSTKSTKNVSETSDTIVTDTNKERKLSRREMTLKVLMSIDEPRSVIEHFCKVTNNYTFFGLLNWIEQIMSAKSEQNNKLGLFFRMYANKERGSIYEEYYNILRSHRLIDTATGEFDTTAMEAMDPETVVDTLQELHNVTEKYLMTKIIFDGFFETSGYENCLIDYYDEIKAYKDNKIKEQIVDNDNDDNDEDNDRKRSDNIDIMISEDRTGKYMDNGVMVRDTIENADDVLSSMDHVSVDDDVMYDHSE